jgi:triphosphoribosyl-dephospho-CoA synthase
MTLIEPCIKLDSNCEKAQHIARCLQLAIILEVSADKPGNVNLAVNFEGTRAEHFIASSIAAGPSFQKAACRGIQIAQNKREISKAGLGELIKYGAMDISNWQHGGNTLLGTIMLFAPLAVSAGMTPTKKNFVPDLTNLRKNMNKVIKATTAQDSLKVYEAIDIAKPSGLNESPELSVKNPNSKARLIQENVTLLDVFKIASGYDDICSEWVNNFPITFDLAYPYLKEQLERKDLKVAIIDTFLTILAKHPDTFIARKVGLEKAKEVSLGAKKILDLGGAEAPEGKEALISFDKRLRKAGNSYNPGTTADITAAALALGTLSGYRP